MNALARRGKWEEVEAILVDMMDGGYKPNENAYDSLLQAYVNGNHINKFKVLVQDMHLGFIYQSWILLKELLLFYRKCNFLKEIEDAFTELKR